MPLLKKRLLAILGILSLLSLAFTACQSGPTEEEAEALWANSAHANAEANAFTRWNDADPPEIPINCAKCHSTDGYHDFLGLDGSTPGQVDNPAPVGSTVACAACHNEVSSDRDQARMPSGVELSGLGENSDCMECHQGRASGLQVHQTIADLPLDEVNSDLAAPSVHNSPAGPLLYGTQAAGGYEYEGKKYAGRYDHVTEFDTCIECHEAHSLTFEAKRCQACHTQATDLANIRTIRSGNIDFDGNGSTSEGLSREIASMEQKLWAAIQLYTERTAGVEPIVINGRFTNQAGEAYSTWTPRLLRASFNYQVSTLGKGAYVHNPTYTLQLLYDSIEDLGGSTRGLTRP